MSSLVVISRVHRLWSGIGRLFAPRRASHLRRQALLTLLSLVLAFAGSWLPSAAQAAAAAAPDADAKVPIPEKIQFNRDIRPIFSDTCFKCHGPDAKARKAKLRLDVREEAVRPRDGKPPILPGKSSESEAYRRMITSNADDLMPPPDSHKTLTKRQIEVVKRWIDQGAKYEAHWAYAPLQSPETTPPDNTLSKGDINFIDSFIRSRLKQEGLQSSPEADRVTLIRRLSFDLTGLPPSPAEVEQFLHDKSPDAYATLVDTLLRSPHFGERMAVWWLDLVRYADSVGYHSDTPMHVWPYRDYVIRSFNANKPFDVFTTEQIAGDLFPNASREQKIASAYNRLLQTTEEGGAQAKEYEFIYACDRVRNTGGAWMGATLLCCQCHDHRYDPFTMRDFYSFAAFFADIQEPIVGARGRGLLLPTEKEAAELKRYDESIAAAKKTLETDTPELQAAQKTWEEGLGHEAAWSILNPTRLESTDGTQLSHDDAGIITASGKFPAKDTYTFTLPLPTDGLRALRLEAISDASLPASGPGLADNGNFVLNEVSIARVDAAGKHEAVAFKKAWVDFSQDGYDPAKLIDGKPDSSGWAVLPQAGKSHQAVLEFKEPLNGKPTVEVKLAFLSQFGRHQLGKLRLAVSDSDKAAAHLSVPVKIRDLIVIEPSKRTAEQRKDIATHYRSIAPALDPTRKQLTQLNQDRGKLDSSIPSCLVSESGTPREVRIHARGNWQNDSGAVMQPGVPEVLGHLSTTNRATRMDLARWMVSPNNALTARVFANRVWKLLFGTGISKTLFDSGSQSEAPTHPELLDRLALEFIRSGWNVQQLIRSMVMSSTYRQSSVASKLAAEHDPYNRLYSHQSSFRLEAEFIRDNALRVSGLLVDKQGGPSVFPYQPAGYWAPLNFPTREWQNSKGEGLYRRGLYTHWQRTFLHPSLAAFDACSREESTAERSRSNIPQQALALLNDPTYVEAARALAAAVLKEPSRSARERLDDAAARVLHRKLRSDERRVLLDLQKRHWTDFSQDRSAAEKLLHVGDSAPPSGVDVAELASWTSVTRALLNLHEFITRE